MEQTKTEEGSLKKAIVSPSAGDRQKEKEPWSRQGRFRCSFRQGARKEAKPTKAPILPCVTLTIAR